MTPQVIGAYAAAIVAVLGALTTFLHSLGTRRQLAEHQASPEHVGAGLLPGGPSSPGA